MKASNSSKESSNAILWTNIIYKSFWRAPTYLKVSLARTITILRIKMGHFWPFFHMCTEVTGVDRVTSESVPKRSWSVFRCVLHFESSILDHFRRFWESRNFGGNCQKFRPKCDFGPNTQIFQNWSKIVSNTLPERPQIMPKSSRIRPIFSQYLITPF